MSNTAVTLRPKPRLPKPAYAEIEEPLWQILTDSIFPTATDPNVIWLAYELCKYRKLDIMRRPYHVMRVWSSAAGREIEQLVAGINELLVTATRTGEFAGVDPPVYGPWITETFVGRRKRRERDQETWADVEVTISYPETISITVYRYVQGNRCAFVMPIRWREEYQRVGPTQLPNDTWTKRSIDQAQKVALAASLRVAFSDVCTDDPEDLSVAARPGEAEIIDQEPERVQPADKIEPQKVEPPHDAETGELLGPHELVGIENEDWQQWGARMIAAVNTSETDAVIEAWTKANARHMAQFEKDRPVMFAKVQAAINRHRNRLSAAKDGGNA